MSHSQHCGGQEHRDRRRVVTPARPRVPRTLLARTAPPRSKDESCQGLAHYRSGNQERCAHGNIPRPQRNAGALKFAAGRNRARKHDRYGRCNTCRIAALHCGRCQVGVDVRFKPCKYGPVKPRVSTSVVPLPAGCRHDDTHEPHCRPRLSLPDSQLLDSGQVGQIVTGRWEGNRFLDIVKNPC